MENPERTFTGTGLITRMDLVALLENSGLEMTKSTSGQRLET